MDIHNIRLQALKQIIRSKSEKNRISDFCRMYDVDPAQVSQWMNGYRNIGEKVARSIEKKVGLEAGWMDQDHSQDPATKNDERIITQPLYSVPIISWNDVLSFLGGEKMEEKKRVAPIGYVPTTQKLSKKAFAVPATGESVRAEFPKGTFVVLEPKLANAVQDGDIALVEFEDGDLVLQKIVQEGTRILATPLQGSTQSLEKFKEIRAVAVGSYRELMNPGERM